MRPTHWLYTVPLRFRSIFHRLRVEHELDEELQYHLDMKIEENLAKGMSREEARRCALIALGGLEQNKEECRDARGLRWLVELQRNLVYAKRILWKQKALSVTVILLLAFGGAANITIFSVYNGLFLRPFPVPNSERLVDLDETAPKWNQKSTGLDYTDFHEWRKENRSFEAMGLYSGPRMPRYFRQGKSQITTALAVTYDFASVLQIQPMLGRVFCEQDDLPGAPKTVMLGYGFWQREFDGSVSALGDSLKLDEEVYTVVGVLPSNADFPRKADMWIPLQMSPSNLSRVYYLKGIARLKEGITLERAREDITRIHKNVIEVRPVNAITSPRLQTLPEGIFGNYRQSVLILQLAVAMLLLIVCSNISGMMLARSESRSQEMGIRTALGSSRSGIIRQLLTESLSLAILGTLLGVLLGLLLLRILTLALLGLNYAIPSWVRLNPDVRFLGFCGLLMVATTVLFGLAPALQATRVNLQRTLHGVSLGSSSSIAKRRGLRVLVAGEVAFAFVLLIGAGLLLRSWQKVLAVDPQFQVDNVLTFMIDLPVKIYKRPEDLARFYDQLMDRCRQLPGVMDVTGAMPAPLSGGYSYSFLEIEGIPPRASDEPYPWILGRCVFPGYFKAMGIPVLSGRPFMEEDGRTKDTQVAIVNQSFVSRFWPNVNPIGKRIRYRDEGMTGEWRTVIGVSRDSKEYGLDKETPPAVYSPYNQIRCNAMYVFIRSNVNPNGLLGPIRSQLHEIDPDILIIIPRTMKEWVMQYAEGRGILFVFMLLFGAAALLITAAGVYGVVHYSVSRRIHEIGIRMALGATRGRVLGMVIGEGLVFAVAGAAFGVVAAIPFSQAIKNSLFGITAFDAPTYFIVGAVLISVVAGASLFPARRATCIEPMQALRSE